MNEGTVVPKKKGVIDAIAIAFVTNIDGAWQRIGYVVQ